MSKIPYIPNSEERQAIIFRALREVVESDAFRRSARIIRFLEYVVLESLSATPKLTEKTIGVVVFDRDQDWDPKLDPIVRIEARRLRQKLGQYYLSASNDQTVVMELPKGGYRISFEWRLTPPSVERTVSQAGHQSLTFKQPFTTEDGGLVIEPTGALPMWQQRSSWFWVIFVIVSVGFAAITLSVSDYRVTEDLGIQIDSLRVDKGLNQEIDGTSLAGKIADQVRQLQQNTRATWSPPMVEDSWTTQHVGGWSSRIGESLRSLGRPQDGQAASITEVSGSIEESGTKEISLYLRGSALAPKTLIGQKKELPRLLHLAAEYIYGTCQPSSYSVYLIEHGRSAEAIDLASSRYPKARHLGDRVQLLYSWATALSQEGDHEGAIEKYQQNIDMAPESWGSHVALQDEFEDLGEQQRALDTGHQLESRAHRGSWWFEHLPPRLFRHPGADAYMATDELTNDYITLKSSIEVELRTHEGGAELLPLYSSYAQVLSRLHERLSAHLQLELAASRKDPGPAEGELIHTKVLLASEEQDDTQLQSTLTSYRNTIMDASSRQALGLQPYAACQLMVAYERTGDTDMSDLLSTMSNDSADCLSLKATVQISRGNTSQAYSLFQRAISDAPSLPSPHYEFGLFLLKQGDALRARKELGLAHTTGPHWAEPLETLAEVAMEEGDLRTALTFYRQAALCAPLWGKLHISWAEALVRDGKSGEAEEQIRLAQSMELSPSEEADLKRVSSSIQVHKP